MSYKFTPLFEQGQILDGTRHSFQEMRKYLGGLPSTERSELQDNLSRAQVDFYWKENKISTQIVYGLEP